MDKAERIAGTAIATEDDWLLEFWPEPAAADFPGPAPGAMQQQQQHPQQLDASQLPDLLPQQQALQMGQFTLHPPADYLPGLSFDTYGGKPAGLGLGGLLPDHHRSSTDGASALLQSSDFMLPMGLSRYRLAKEIGVPAPRIGDIVSGKRAVTADTDLRL